MRFRRWKPTTIPPAADAMNEAADVRIDLADAGAVSGLLNAPDAMRALYVLGHGAGAGMRHAFMEQIASDLAARGIGTLRYQFPYMEKGGRRPDRPAVAHATIRAAVAQARVLAPGVPLFAGGKSFGGRMTSQAEAAEPLGVGGLIFLGFPLHPAGKPGIDRADHLSDIDVPMLFLQGTRDTLANLDLLRPVLDKLGHKAALEVIEDGDHSFKVRKSVSGLSAADVMADLAERSALWIDRALAG